MDEETELDLDLAGIASEKALHDYLSKMFQFPEYYGSNWDAFDECIRHVELPKTIRIHHFSELESLVPRGARLLRECLEDFSKEKPGKARIEFCQQGL